MDADWHIDVNRRWHHSSSPAGAETLAQPLHPDEAGAAVLLDEGRHPGRLAAVPAVLRGGASGGRAVAEPRHVGGGAALEVVPHCAVVQSAAPLHPTGTPWRLAHEVPLDTVNLVVVEEDQGEGEAVQDEVDDSTRRHHGHKCH